MEERLIAALAASQRETAQAIVNTHPIDLAALAHLSAQHMVSTLVLQRLSALQLPAALQERTSALSREAVFATMAANARYRRELALLAGLFADVEIDFVLIKGQAVDKDPLRRTNDLDVLIRQADLQRAFAALEHSGYEYAGSGVLSEKERRRPESQLAWNNQFQFRSPHSGLSVEVHINLFERDRIRLENLDRLLDNIQLFWEGRSWDSELGCFVPAAEASLALLCVHSATKRSPAHNTYILRHAYDIVQLLERGVDQERFLTLCRVWGIAYYAYVSLRLAALSLGAAAPAAAAAQLEPELSARTRRLAEIHCRCFRGLGRASAYHRMRYTLYMPFAIGGGLHKALVWYRQAILPPLWKQEERFGISRSSPAIYLTYLVAPFARAYAALGGRRR